MATKTKKSSLGDVTKKTKQGGDWFETGWGSATAAVKKQDKEIEEGRNNVARLLFWLKPDTEAKLIFVDGEPTMMHIHEVTPGGDWKKRTYKVCLGTGCPFCGADIKVETVGFFTVIDTRKYTSPRDKKEHQYEPRLYMAKVSTLKVLAKNAEKRGNDLTGCVVDVMRSGEKSPRSGDGFNIEKKVNLKDPAVLKKMGKTAPPKPYEYEKLLAPMPKKEAIAYVEALSGAPGPDASDAGDSDDIPF